MKDPRILFKDNTNTTNTRSVMKEAKQAPVPTTEKAEKKLSTPNETKEVKKEEVKKQSEMKQIVWVDQVNRAIEAVNDEQLKDLLQKIQGFVNIPRTKAKFIKFLVNSFNIRDRDLCSLAWSAIAKDTAKKKKEEPSTPKDTKEVKKDKKKEEDKKQPSTPVEVDTPSSLLPPYSIAIFDTCALIHCNDILETTIKKNVIAVLPYKVLEELGHHAITRIEKTLQMEANRVLRSIDIVENDPLFFTERRKANSAKLTGLDMSNHRHDKILKCALRVHQHMSDQKRTIWLVTNDNNLRLKAAEWGAPFIVIGTQKFMDNMKMRMVTTMMTKKKRSEKMMEADDLEKLRICLRQPKKKEKEKLSTVILKKGEKSAEKRARKQLSKLQSEVTKAPWTAHPEMAFYDMGEKEDRMMMYENGWAPGMSKKRMDRMMMRVADESLY